MKKRATQHNGRANQGKAYNPRHNDRHFKESEIETDRNPALEKYNFYWTRYEGGFRGKDKEIHQTFEQTETLFYELNFTSWLSARNEKQKKNRHYDRVMSMDEIRNSPRYCPEETILQIGNKDNYRMNGQTYFDVMTEQIEWEKKTFPNRKVLDFAIHFDETTPHVHVRSVWVGHNADGSLFPSQSAALREMGIERPDITKAEGRFNNPKMAFSAVCRKHFLEVCKAHGLEIETVPKDPSRSGLSLLEFKTRAETEKLYDLQEQLQKTKNELEEISAEIETARHQKQIVDMILSPIRTDRFDGLDEPDGR